MYNISKNFNKTTRGLLLNGTSGYVTKTYNGAYNEYNKESYRFDLGENVICESVMLKKYIERLKDTNSQGVNNYPDALQTKLRTKIAKINNIDPNMVVVSNGLDDILDLISRIFIGENNHYVNIVPSFYLFDSYSIRMGAKPLFVELDENDNFKLTNEKILELKTKIKEFKPKILWFANPNNPTGGIVPKSVISDIIGVAHNSNTFVVVDEAYIEYLKDFNDVSTMDLVKKYNNLIVLRTFSKAYGLANMRIGYMVSSSIDIINAILALRAHFPVTQMAHNMACVVLNDDQFLHNTQIKTRIIAHHFFKKMDKLKKFKYIKSSTNIFLIKCACLTIEQLKCEFEINGILTSYVNSPINNLNFNYLRITIRHIIDNDYFYYICKKIEYKISRQIAFESIINSNVIYTK